MGRHLDTASNAHCAVAQSYSAETPLPDYLPPILGVQYWGYVSVLGVLRELQSLWNAKKRPDGFHVEIIRARSDSEEKAAKKDVAVPAFFPYIL